MVCNKEDFFLPKEYFSTLITTETTERNFLKKDPSVWQLGFRLKLCYKTYITLYVNIFLSSLNDIAIREQEKVCMFSTKAVSFV